MMHVFQLGASKEEPHNLREGGENEEMDARMDGQHQSAKQNPSKIQRDSKLNEFFLQFVCTDDDTAGIVVTELQEPQNNV